MAMNGHCCLATAAQHGDLKERPDAWSLAGNHTRLTSARLLSTHGSLIFSSRGSSSTGLSLFHLPAAPRFSLSNCGISHSIIAGSAYAAGLGLQIQIQVQIQSPVFPAPGFRRRCHLFTISRSSTSLICMASSWTLAGHVACSRNALGCKTHVLSPTGLLRYAYVICKHRLQSSCLSTCADT